MQFLSQNLLFLKFFILNFKEFIGSIFHRKCIKIIAAFHPELTLLLNITFDTIFHDMILPLNLLLFRIRRSPLIIDPDQRDSLPRA